MISKLKTLEELKQNWTSHHWTQLLVKCSGEGDKSWFRHFGLYISNVTRSRSLLGQDKCSQTSKKCKATQLKSLQLAVLNFSFQSWKASIPSIPNNSPMGPPPNWYEVVVYLTTHWFGILVVEEGLFRRAHLIGEEIFATIKEKKRFLQKKKATGVPGNSLISNESIHCIQCQDRLCFRCVWWIRPKHCYQSQLWVSRNWE